MKRCVIIGAAEIRNYEKISKFFNSDDFVIFCDGGLSHIDALKQRGLSPLKPNLVIGDFDSHFRPADDIVDGKKVEVIQLPCEKDDTDVFFAVKEALGRGFSEFVFAGVIGQRFDHSMVNISVLMYLQEHKAAGVIFDDYSEMKLVAAGETPVLITDDYSYFSLLCIDGDVSGVTIRNAKYPLENALITSGYQYGISNEVLPGQIAEVSLKKGRLLLIKVW